MELQKYEVPDCLFPTDNDLEIPSLRLDMQPEVCDIPFVCYGEQKRTFQMNGNGTLHFYTDDYRFNTIYDHPEQILNHNPRNIVEPNYSIFNETPIAFGMQAVYKKRFLGRAMQERGIRVFADLNVSAKFYKLNLLGIPRGYSAFCTRGYSDRLQYLAFEHEMAKVVADSNPLTFVVYGGGTKVKQYCQKHGLIYVTPVVSVKKKLSSLEKIQDTIAFFGTEIKQDIILPKAADLLAKQIEDFSKGKFIDK